MKQIAATTLLCVLAWLAGASSPASATEQRFAVRLEIRRPVRVDWPVRVQDAPGGPTVALDAAPDRSVEVLPPVQGGGADAFRGVTVLVQ
jgi:hypothetical protein